jgi:tetratricopeptide (TPR) repeat protein
MLKAQPQLRKTMRVSLFLLALLISLSAVAQSKLAISPASRQILALMQAQKFDEALKQAEAQVASNSNSAEAFYWLGAVNGRLAQTSGIFSKLGYAKAVRKAFDRAAELDPKQIEARMGLIQFHLQAPGLAGGDEDLVPALVQQISAIDVGAGYRAQALVKQVADDQAGAEVLYRKALTHNPADVDALTTMVSLLTTAKKVADAEVLVNAALAKEPNNQKIQYQKAKCAALGGNDPAAGLAIVDSILTANPPVEGISLPGAHWRRGQLLERLGRKDEAIKAMERSISLDSNIKEVKADLARLRKS